MPKYSQQTHSDYMATRASLYVCLFIVVIVCTDKSFQLFEKNVFAFWMLIKEQLFRSALICDTSVKMSLS